LRKVVESLIAQTGYRFGDPWRPRDRSIALVVPILRTGDVGVRDYVLLEEVGDGVEVRDTGRIGGLSVRNSTGKPVFIRGGTVLKGAGTQSRAVRFGTVVQPRKTLTVESRCVHASHPIVTGRRFKPVAQAPRVVYSALASGSQQAVWSAVSNFARASARLGLTETPMIAYDDLVAVTSEIDKAKDLVRKAVEGLPIYESQVGAVVLDIHGVVAFELFDHPDSWKALAKSVVKSLADVLSEESELFEPNRGKVEQAIHKFLAKLLDADEEKVWEDSGSATFLIKGEGVVGEYTVLDGKLIHLFAAKSDEREIRRTAPEQPWYETTVRRPAERWRIGWMRTMLNNPTYTCDIVSRLTDRAMTWSELYEDLRRTSSISTRTLSKWLKRMESTGYIAKITRENGKKAYMATAKALAELEE